MKYTVEEEKQIISLYLDNEYTLRHIADLFGTNHHMIKAILVRNNIQIVKHKTKKIYSEERKQKLSEM